MVCLVATLTGCGAEPGPETVPVSGVVLWKGEPVEGALVVFLPKNESDESMIGAQAVTDAEGNFQLQTYVGGANLKDGIQPGNYVVTVTKLEVIQDMRRKPKNLLPGKYAAAATTDLAAVVTEGDAQSLTLEIE